MSLLQDELLQLPYPTLPYPTLPYPALLFLKIVFVQDFLSVTITLSMVYHKEMQAFRMYVDASM